MIQHTLTPAQSYADRMIKALDNFLADPENTEAADEVLITVLERPRTLRGALNAYLYKSISAQIQRR